MAFTGKFSTTIVCSHLLISITLIIPGLMTSSSACYAESPKEENPVAVAIFAGGCFWCMEPPYDELEGVISTTSGYIGGPSANPTYKQVSAGGTGHFEAIEVRYDPKKISYEKLLDVFWRNIDPLDDRGQFCDKGSQYLSGIFYLNEQQKTAAEASRKKLNSLGKLGSAVVTKLYQATTFYPAEDYHQDYYKKSSLRYKYYRNGCGRDRRLAELWGKD